MRQDKNGRVLRFYSFLLNLYPSSFAKEFHNQMLQTFKDHYNDVFIKGGNVGIEFWFETISDAIYGVVRERTYTLKKPSAYHMVIILTPILFLGSILTLPVISLFSIYILEVTFLLIAYFSIRKLSGIKVGKI